MKFRKIAVRKSLVVVAALLGIGTFSSVAMASGGDIEIPVSGKNTTVIAEVRAGSGDGRLVIEDGQLMFTATAKSLGKYQENWRMEAAVMDFRLPQPVALSPDSRRLSWVYRQPSRQGWTRVALRVLVRGADGRVRSWGTRFSGKRSTVDPANSFERMETYGWDASETGRFDPWVMTGEDWTRDVSYQPPGKPLTLVGFRLIVLGEGEISPLTLKNLRDETALQPPQPYWTISYDRSLMEREQLPWLRVTSIPVRFGWGPEQRGPFLRPSDLRLRPGQYTVNWEVLDALGWKQLRSGSESLQVGKPGDESPEVVEIPLMSTGSYALRLHIRPAGEPAGQAWYFSYTVIRNATGASAAVQAPASKPLVFRNAGGDAGNIYTPGDRARVTIACAEDANSFPNDAKIVWSVRSADGRQLTSGDSPAHKPATLDLTQMLKRENALWIQARLQGDGRTIDLGQRVIGLRAPKPAAASPAKAAASASKRNALKGQIRRTRGDWSEGSSPIVSRHQQQLELFDGWIAEAKQLGYNMVEMSATWAELEPLPGVFVFQYLDPFVELARKNDMHVVFRVHPTIGGTPAFVPRELQASSEGLAHGLWAGSSNEVFSPGSQTLAKPYLHYLEALAAHYRDNPMVVGYTLANLFFDHVYFEMPFLGQYVDYSEAMRQAFIRFLRSEYGNSLAKLREAHGRDYVTWEDVQIPSRRIEFDEVGRLRPRSDALWRDWTRCKVAAMQDTWRLEALAALRRGDPGSMVGLYSDLTRRFLEQTYSKIGAFVPQGSMEAQFPPPLHSYPVRYEPHAKVARHPRVADVGMTNLLFYKPGFNGLFNYWQDRWRLDNVPELQRQAEERFSRWFAVVDRLAGAKMLGNAADHPAGLEISSMETMLYNWQHIFAPRTEDYVKPFRYQAQREKVRCDQMLTPAMTAESLSAYRYIYLPYGSDTLTSEQLDMLERYVRDGGKLILEPTSGFWKVGAKAPNALGGRLELPEIRPVSPSDSSDPSEKAEPISETILRGIPIAFRTMEFSPPTDDQPAAWIHNALKYYFQRYRITGHLPGGAIVLARFADGQPAAWRYELGKGQVLVFSGVIDWLNCPGLALRLDNWARGNKLDQQLPPAPDLLTAHYEKDGVFYVLGRRFVGQAALQHLKEGKTPAGGDDPVSLPVRFQHLPDARYRVRELVGDSDLGTHSGKWLQDRGVRLELRPGEGFLLEAKPMP